DLHRRRHLRGPPRLLGSLNASASPPALTPRDHLELSALRQGDLGRTPRSRPHSGLPAPCATTTDRRRGDVSVNTAPPAAALAEQGRAKTIGRCLHLRCSCARAYFA